MPKPTGFDDITSHSKEHEQRSEVMLTTLPTTSPQLRHPAYNNNRTTILSDNGTLIVHVLTNPYKYNNINREINNNTTHDNSISTIINHNNSATTSYEELSNEFYQSYDPSTGLHTAAVLGGILVWLVIYVIYRTKVRKCVLRIIKKQFGGEEGELDPKILDTDLNSGANTSMVRTLVNPSIVIDTSPPDSSLTCDQYIRPMEETCFSPNSFHEVVMNEDGVFSYPFTGHREGSQQYLNNYQAQACSSQREILHQLPKSELDIATATAKWVHNMPLETRSHQDFTSLMLSLQSRGLLAMHKPCSCPSICPATPQPLLRLELPSSWNKSLPVLPNSLSSQVLSAYDAVPMKHTSDNDIRNMVNAKRQSSTYKYKSENNDQVLSDKNSFEKPQNRQRYSSHFRRDHTKKKPNVKMTSNLTLRTTDTKENQPLLDSSNNSRSPIPIPITPTVMIQTTRPKQRHHQDCDSNTSYSSNSSADLLLASRRAPPIQITEPCFPIPFSQHHLSPTVDNRTQNKSPNVFSWSQEDIKKYHDEKRISDFTKPLLTYAASHQCSLKHQRRQSQLDKEYYYHRQHCSFDENNAANEERRREELFPRRSLSDYNYHGDFLLNKRLPTGEHIQNSISANIQVLEKLPDDITSPENSNTNSSRAFCFNPSPYLLQVPDPNNTHISKASDFGGSNKSHLGVPTVQTQPLLRHGVHSDSNIAYFTCQLDSGDSNVDHFSVRPHSAFTPGEINLSFCEDNTVRPSSSFGSTGSCNSPHRHHPQLPHRRSSQHHQLHHDHHHHHHSTGMLGLEDNTSQHNISYISHQHPFMNRSFSAVVMETKL